MKIMSNLRLYHKLINRMLPTQKALISKGFERHGFNEEVCKKISLHRSINGRSEHRNFITFYAAYLLFRKVEKLSEDLFIDTLSVECKQHNITSDYGTASVIIIFHNEATCTLYRKVPGC